MIGVFVRTEQYKNQALVLVVGVFFFLLIGKVGARDRPELQMTANDGTVDSEHTILRKM